MSSYSTAHRNAIAKAVTFLEALKDAYEQASPPSDATLANVEAKLAEIDALLGN